MRNNINYIISEEINNFINILLTEDDSSKSIKAAKKLCVTNGMNNNEADAFVRNTMREYIPNLHGLGDKFILGCTRLYLGGAINDNESKELLTQIIGYICDNKEYYNKFDRNLNLLSLNDLAKIFQPIIKDKLDNDRSSLEGKEFKNNGYDVVPINSFEEAQAYQEYTYSKSQWCITYSLSNYNGYSNNGANQIYFCLKHGYKNIKTPKETGNCKDEYGLSMISVIVNPDGNLVYSTTRWNHMNGANGEHDLTTQEISKIVGVNFYETFKPNTVFQDKIANCLEKLKQGYPIEKIFDEVGKFNEGLAAIKLNKKFNFITKDGKVLSPNKWFDWVCNFSGEWGVVELNDKYNFINKNGNYLSPNQWFTWASSFNDDWALIELNSKRNLINKNGNYLSPNQWFDGVDFFKEGWAVIHLNGKYNWINVHGDYLFPDQWFDLVGPFNNDLAPVKIDGKYNWINKHGKLLSPNQWFNWIEKFHQGWAQVEVNRKRNLINTEGKLLSPSQWFDSIGNLKNGWAVVVLNSQLNFINQNGQLKGKWEN